MSQVTDVSRNAFAFCVQLIFCCKYCHGPGQLACVIILNGVVPQSLVHSWRFSNHGGPNGFALLFMCIQSGLKTPVTWYSTLGPLRFAGSCVLDLLSKDFTKCNF